MTDLTPEQAAYWLEKVGHEGMRAIQDEDADMWFEAVDMAVEALRERAQLLDEVDNWRGSHQADIITGFHAALQELQLWLDTMMDHIGGDLR